MCHRQKKNRQAEKQRDPKPPRHVIQISASVIRRRIHRLKRHAALGTVARLLPQNLRMHGTSVNRVLRWRRNRLPGGRQKFSPARFAAKVKHLPRALPANRSGFIHLHATNRIDSHLRKAWRSIRKKRDRDRGFQNRILEKNGRRMQRGVKIRLRPTGHRV